MTTLEVRMAKALLANDPQERNVKTKAAACANAARDFFTDFLCGVPTEGGAAHVVSAAEYVVFNRSDWASDSDEPIDEVTDVMVVRISHR